MTARAGGTELAGDVAFIDGKLYPLRSFECSVEHNTETVGLASSMKAQTIVNGMEISGTMESYRSVELPAHLGRPAMHDVYLFSAKNGTDERVFLSGVFFEPKRKTNSRTQTIDFIAKDIQYD